MAARRIEEGSRMTQRDYVVEIQGTRTWRRRQAEAARRRRRRNVIQMMHGVLTATLAVLLLHSCGTAKAETEPAAQAVAEPAAVVLLNEGQPSPAPEQTPEPVANTMGTEAEYIAKTLYGEARGCSTTEQAAVVWCVLNRVDDGSGLWPDDIIGVVTQEYQFAGYSPEHPVLPELYDLALDVLERWQREKAGEDDVGRVLPADYCYFHGDGKHNYFRQEYEGGPAWDWGLETPYEG